MKKINKINLLFIIICLVLIISYIVQLTAYKKTEKRLKEVVDDGKEYAISDKKFQVEGNASIYPRNLNKFMEKYKGDYESKDIGQRMFKFINEDINVIYNEYKDKDENAIKEAYGQNKKEISDLEIESVEDIIGLNKQISILKKVNN